MKNNTEDIIWWLDNGADTKGEWVFSFRFASLAAAGHASHPPNVGGKGAERCLPNTQPGTPARQTPLRTTAELSAHRWMILRIVECD